jgi:hypothetical protein
MALIVVENNKKRNLIISEIVISKDREAPTKFLALRPLKENEPPSWGINIKYLIFDSVEDLSSTSPGEVVLSVSEIPNGSILDFAYTKIKEMIREYKDCKHINDKEFNFHKKLKSMR